ncbi:hypothetical protein [Mesorhizobium dulcispinae]|uniref:hypothetical protein n=1 Tax=Mesorhizobium dulcispinae TaxID=3072316 RepID=UPI002A2462F3|nr:hypothetical protein [Mesorhizobium sp. VK23D]MDX8522468.1 hypothetical protein [Mesorhizobium sp. VK23D]
MKLSHWPPERSHGGTPWQFFVAADVLVVGYVTTAAHWLFVVAHLAVMAGSTRLAASSSH